MHTDFIDFHRQIMEKRKISVQVVYEDKGRATICCKLSLLREVCRSIQPRHNFEDGKLSPVPWWNCAEATILPGSRRL